MLDTIEIAIVVLVFVLAAWYVGRTFVKQFTGEDAGCHCSDCGAKSLLNQTKSGRPV